jgi:Tfp pilus assembly protein PilO
MKEKFRKLAVFILIVWIITLIGMGSFFYFVIMPQKNNLDALFTKVEHEIETNLVASHAKEKIAAELMDAKVGRACDLLNRFLIEKSEVNNFIFDFQRLADSSGISNFTGSHDPSKSYFAITGLKYIKEGNLRINFSGDYIQFINLLNKLERYQPVVFVDRFSISRTRVRERDNNINMTLTFFSANEKVE